ncbi:uncharacterized protein TNCV_1786061 [Trichonephila clavipes]|nr:uncharacterized protein TNCV_1786061 [Trichonephila clavipes]
MKALKFYKELKESEPSTSSRESEVASADEEAARKYPEKLAKIIKDGEYCAHQVFNADETGLFWEKMPTRTYIANGFKAAKDREIGGEGFDDFGEHDIEELLVDEALNDDDILESMVDITKDLETVDSEPEDVTPLDEKLLREGLQLSDAVRKDERSVAMREMNRISGNLPGRPIGKIGARNITKGLPRCHPCRTIKSPHSRRNLPDLPPEHLQREWRCNHFFQYQQQIENK